MSEYAVGDWVEVRVPDHNNRDVFNWMPGIVTEVTETSIISARRGNRFAKVGMMYMGWQGDKFAVPRHDTYSIRRPPSFTASHDPEPRVESQMRAMRSAVAWYVAFLERERDG